MREEMKNLKPHPIAEKFPMMGDDEYQGLVRGMREHGFDPVFPIILLDGMILDGRNRYRAALETGAAAAFNDFEGENPWDFVWLANATRRHLPAGQIAAIFQDFDEGGREWTAYREAEVRAENAMLANQARAAALQARARDELGRTLPSGAQDCARLDTPGQRAMVALGEPVNEPEPVIPEFLPVRPTSPGKVAAARGAVAGVSQSTMEKAKRLKAEAPDLHEKVKKNEISLDQGLGELKKKVVRDRLEDVVVVEAKRLSGVYDVIVIDPPWPMKKLEREVRPNQAEELDYPTMSEEEILAMKLPAAEDCHLWLWTTQRFLPLAFRCLEAWGFSYSCEFIWHKPGGFQVVGLPQYNHEPCLYARRGTPSFVDTKAFFTCFSAARGGHSEKPSEFYDVIRRVTAGRRIDMFNRRPFEGFDVWGKEASDITGSDGLAGKEVSDG